ncbi:PIN domain-containing protein [Burkholderia cepacia]|uniref:PIN domain-containing protein n=1 Tax=Burkholderia cepacia TaxID=292 RepID=UPI001CF196AB|nr:PIN domain-containing protein [Burkholderia cepacia]MCA8320612.1 PIN domain-containing protein [Burkholderia cepacia]
MLTVVFDTNAVFNKEFDTLICRAARDLIGRHSNHGDLGIRWVIPDIVRGEREFQMRNEFRNVSTHVTKAESLFGQQWGVTQDAVEQRIAARINEELAAMRIDVVPCVTGRVDWNDVMRRSCFREPPFERGQTEKGFRDAIVCETFIQIASDLIGGDTAVLVSGDLLVRRHIDSRGIAGNRARVVDDLDALNDEIQLRVANVDEDTQADIERLAQARFYPWENRDDLTSLWVRENIYERVWTEHGDRLRQVPNGTEHVFIAQELSNARLVTKVGNRVHLESTLLIQSGFKVWVPAQNVQPDMPASIASLGIGGQIKQGLYQLSDLAPNTLAGLMGMHPPAGEWKQIAKPAKDTILIRWSATFSRRRTLTRPTIDSIDLIEQQASAASFNRGVDSAGG